MESTLDTHESRRSRGDRTRQRKYLAEFLPAMVVYAALLAGALTVGKDSTAGKVLLVAVPVLPFAMITMAVVRVVPSGRRVSACPHAAVDRDRIRCSNVRVTDRRVHVDREHRAREPRSALAPVRRWHGRVVCRVDSMRTGMKNELRQLRAERGWSQAALADHLDVSRQTVNAIETGRYDPALPLAFRIARLFGLSIEDIFTPEDAPTAVSRRAATASR